MRREKHESQPEALKRDGKSSSSKADKLLRSKIGDSIDLLVEYLADHGVDDIHPLIMGEVEKRLIIRALERNRGNKLQAAKMLGMSRNTFHRKLQKLADYKTTSRESEES